MLRNKILKVCFYVCSTVRNSEHFSLLRNDSERNSDSLFVLSFCLPRNFFLSEIFNPTVVIPGKDYGALTKEIASQLRFYIEPGKVLDILFLN